eukprot:10295953-Lingulodinium_polyedra.AAC.1
MLMRWAVSTPIRMLYAKARTTHCKSIADWAFAMHAFRMELNLYALPKGCLWPEAMSKILMAASMPSTMHICS